jgi:hypothetical protein
MTATTVDASNQLVYLAMAHYAGNEGRGAWVWFMRHCRAAFRDMRHPLCTMNSDGEKGFPGAAREVYGERVLLQRCAQHLEGSVRKEGTRRGCGNACHAHCAGHEPGVA